MGWTPSNSLWLATRGGDVYLSPESGISERFDQAKLGSRGFGILDVGCAHVSPVILGFGGFRKVALGSRW